MLKRKEITGKGKISLAKHLQELNEGERVSVVRDLAVSCNFPRTIQGLTGIVEGRRGKAYIIVMMQGNKEKRFIIEGVHLKKIKSFQQK